jgi:ribose/xylose/arabinose/galactoside ABC-type transport system permease subunit
MSGKTGAESRGKKVVKAIFHTREMSLVIVVLLMVIVLSISTNTFFRMANIMNVLKQMSITCILALGMTFCISAGGIDLSNADNMALSSVVMATVLTATHSDIIAIIVALAISAFIGLLNGLTVNKIGLNPFITTLGMDSICSGLALVITKGFPVYIPNKSFTYFLGQGNIFAGTTPVLILCIPIFVLIGKFVFDDTVLGNQMLAVGGNRAASALSGLNVVKLNVMSYVICGIFSGIAAVMVTGRLNAGNPGAGGTLCMDSIAATIVGGTSMMGGSGTIVGAMLGALLMQLIRNGLVLWNVNMYWQTTVIGAVLILVCSLDSFTGKLKAK